MPETKLLLILIEFLKKYWKPILAVLILIAFSITIYIYDIKLASRNKEIEELTLANSQCKASLEGAAQAIESYSKLYNTCEESKEKLSLYYSRILKNAKQYCANQKETSDLIGQLPCPKCTCPDKQRPCESTVTTEEILNSENERIKRLK